VDEKIAELRVGFSLWVGLTVGLPTLFLLGLWPVGIYLTKTKEPLIATFVAGDAVLLSSFILIAVSGDLIQHYAFDKSRSLWLFVGFIITLLLAVTCIFITGFLKALAPELSTSAVLSPELRSELINRYYFTLMVLISAILVSVFIKSVDLYLRLQRLQHFTR